MNARSHVYDPLSPAQERSQARVRAKAEEGDQTKADLAAAANARQKGSANTRMSQTDLRAKVAGTNASGPSAGFRTAFGAGSNGNRPAAWRETFGGGGDKESGRGGDGGAPVYDPLAGSNAPSPTRPLAPSPTLPPVAPGRVVNNPGVERLLDNAAGGSVPEKVTAAAGTGAPVATPRGTVSSRAAQPGETLPPATTTATGVQRPPPADWQQQVIAQHPEIGQAGTQANAEFVRAYHAAQAGGQTDIDHMGMAGQVMNNIRTGAGRPAPEGPAPVGAPTPAAPFSEPQGSLLTAGQRPAPAATDTGMKFDTQPVGPMVWDPLKGAPSAAQKAGTAVRDTVTNAGQGALGAVTSGLRAADDAAGKYVTGPVSDFAKGLLGGGSGNKPTAPAPTAGVQTPTVPGANGRTGSAGPTGDEGTGAAAFPLTDPRKKKTDGLDTAGSFAW